MKASPYSKSDTVQTSHLQGAAEDLGGSFFMALRGSGGGMDGTFLVPSTFLKAENLPKWYFSKWYHFAGLIIDQLVPKVNKKPSTSIQFSFKKFSI